MTTDQKTKTARRNMMKVDRDASEDVQEEPREGICGEWKILRF